MFRNPLMEVFCGLLLLIIVMRAFDNKIGIVSFFYNVVSLEREWSMNGRIQRGYIFIYRLLCYRFLTLRSSVIKY